MQLILQPALRVLEWFKQLPSLAKRLRWDYTVFTVIVTLHSAAGLPAADVDFFGRGGTSDPYVNFELAGEVL